MIHPEYKTIRNLEQNIFRPLKIFAQVLFTTNEMELDYYHQKVNVRVVSRVAERLKTPDLRNLRKSLSSKRQILTFEPENCQNSAVKDAIEKPILLNFVSLSTMFC